MRKSKIGKRVRVLPTAAFYDIVRKDNYEKISGFIGKYMAIIVLVVAALALFVPKSCLWIHTGWINYLLMLVMFGMGLTMKLDDFTVVFLQGRAI